jgi:hypothetical protein
MAAVDRGGNAAWACNIKPVRGYLMTALIRTIALGAFACGLSLAQTWSGWLVNGKCYESLERNVNPWDPGNGAQRDRGRQIAYCVPNSKTKVFSIVDRDGNNFKLDATGNTQSVDLVRNAGKRNDYFVTVTGEKAKDTIKVVTVTLDKQGPKW